jgi:hypothetical protein
MRTHTATVSWTVARQNDWGPEADQTDPVGMYPMKRGAIIIKTNEPNILTHELGHVAGLSDVQSGHRMQSVRLVPTVAPRRRSRIDAQRLSLRRTTLWASLMRS